MREVSDPRCIGVDSYAKQVCSVWKPLKGPVKDWPLALCDPTSVDAMDLEAADLVYHDYVVENRQIYRKPGQKWYYISDQQPNEAWIFRQSDSKPGAGVGMYRYLSQCVQC